MLQVSLKLAASGDRSACELNETPFARAFCAMLANGHLRCDKLRGLANGLDTAKESFERAETFIEVCKLLEADHIGECRTLPVSGRTSDKCEMALPLWAYEHHSASSCAEPHSRTSREICRAMLVDDINICTKRIDYKDRLDPPWWAREP